MQRLLFLDHLAGPVCEDLLSVEQTIFPCRGSYTHAYKVHVLA
jgi:hypothetical protein